MYTRLVVKTLVLAGLCAILLPGCGGKHTSTQAQPASLRTAAPAGELESAGPLYDELKAALWSEFERLGIDPDKVAASPPQDDANTVFNLTAGVLPGGPPYSIELTWTERVVGDYNQDGLVGISDITPLGQHYDERVTYDDPALHAGFAGWPAGDPNDDGGNDPPLPDCGAANWRTARIDGNSDGLIYMSDITTIAQHWQERLDGYRVYHRGPGETEFSLVPSAAAPVLVVRPAVDINRPVMYAFELEAGLAGVNEFYVAPYDETSGVAGRASNQVLIDTRNPVAVIEASTDGGPVPLDVTFSAASSYDLSPGGSIIKYEWDWDMVDGFVVDLDSGGDPTVEHTYDTAGTFTPAVRVTDDDDNAAVASLTVVVVPDNYPPVAQITASPLSGLAPLTVDFDATGSTDVDGTIEQYDWDWDGDGTYDLDDGGPTPEHTFEVDGSYNTTVRVVDDAGLDDTASLLESVEEKIRIGFPPVAILNTPEPNAGDAPLLVSFNASDSYDPNGVVVKYEWDWDGDGVFEEDSLLDPTVQHTYDEPNATPYNATVRVTDDTGLTDTDAKQVDVGAKPVADIAADPTTGFSPLTVQFDATASTDDAGEIISYDWDWDGDGAYDLLDGGPVPEHLYDDDGLNNATVRVTDGDANTDTDSLTITVNNTPPVADLLAVPTYGEPPLMVNFNAAASYDVDGSIVQYDYDWTSDGTYDAIDAGPTPSHEYSDSGDYTATVRVSDDDGDTDTAQGALVVVNLAPTADLVATPTFGVPPLTVSFDASGSTDTDGTIVQYDYDWESDGTYDLLDGGTTPSYEYTGSGDFTATVRVTDDDGGQDESTSVTIEVHAMWTHTWGGTGSDYTTDLITDSSGNVYVAGQTESFGEGGFDVLLLKYDSAGTLLWQKTWGGTEIESVNSIALDVSGNVYLAGWTTSYGAGSYDVILLKYNSSGSLLWQKTWGGPTVEYAVSMAVDALGSIFIAGKTESYGAGNHDMLLLKYNSDGELQWQKTWGGADAEATFAMALDGIGNIYLTGSTSSFGEGNEDCVLLKYSSLGNLLWEKIWGGTSVDRITSIAVDSGGSVFLGGFSGNFGNGDEAVLLKYSSLGALLWQKTWGGTNLEWGQVLTLDGSGNVYFAGYTKSFGMGGTDIFLLKYNSSGSLIMQKNWGTSNAEIVQGITFASPGVLFLAGYAPDNSGTWQDATGSANDVTGTASDISGTSNDVTGTADDVTGTETFPTGTEDTGGGGLDALVMRFDPDDL